MFGGAESKAMNPHPQVYAKLHKMTNRQARDYLTRFRVSQADQDTLIETAGAQGKTGWLRRVLGRLFKQKTL